ncbi:hypothetical protein [Streptomyces eurythermus]
MTDAMFHVGTAACFVGCGGLLLAAQRCGRRAAAVEAARPPGLLIPEAEEVPVSPGTGALEDFEPFSAFEAGEVETAEFHYCPAELRVTAHAVHADGSRRCWHCTSQGEA